MATMGELLGKKFFDQEREKNRHNNGDCIQDACRICLEALKKEPISSATPYEKTFEAHQEQPDCT